jgi:hypothetical protein
MRQLESWKIGDLRRLAEDFRRRAAETNWPHYVELMLFTAGQLEAEANRLEQCAGLGQRVSILV